jgi:hypothetical protein
MELLLWFQMVSSWSKWEKLWVLISTEQMNEDPNAKQSWVAEGELSKMLATFSEYPSWVTSIFKYVQSTILHSERMQLLIRNRHSQDLGLWQLRDLVGPQFRSPPMWSN